MKLNSVLAKSLTLSLLLLGSTAMMSCKGSQNARSGQRIIPTANGAIVEVEFYEMKIHMPTVIPKGRITFRITNPSSNDHNFKIKGNGLERQLENDITEGQTVDFTVDLQAGTYGVICPLIGHLDLGERLDLTVTP
ncbi:MAG TPA: hypothetical protein VFH43_02790 [Candidatus Kapabacteria bacterium]|nr:hypothetical protein [Candidatus Kapabacteria bacterium]